jgi:hypothetical protein
MFWLVCDMQQIAFFVRFIRIVIPAELGGFHALGEKQSNLAPAAFQGAGLEQGWRSDHATCNKDQLCIRCNDNCKHIAACHPKRGCQSPGRERSRLTLRFQFWLEHTKTLSGFRVLIMRNKSLTSVIWFAEVNFETWTIVYNTFILSSSPLLVYQTLYIFMWSRK